MNGLVLSVSFSNDCKCPKLHFMVLYDFGVQPLKCYISVTVPAFRCFFLFGADMSGQNLMKYFYVHTLSIGDLDHPAISSLLQNPACSDFKLQFSRSTGDDSSLLGSV